MLCLPWRLQGSDKILQSALSKMSAATTHESLAGHQAVVTSRRSSVSAVGGRLC